MPLRYVVNAARAAKVDSPQRLVYISVCPPSPSRINLPQLTPWEFQTGMADPSSRFLYSRSKGLTELGLAKLGYADTIIFRPGVLAGTHRGETRIPESIAVYVAHNHREERHPIMTGGSGSSRELHRISRPI